MNLAPVRGTYLDRYCGASPAHNMRPLQGQQRELMSCGGDRGKPLSWNMRPLQGQSPASERPGNSLIRCYAVRGQHRIAAQPATPLQNSINSNLRRERPERAASSQPRATPWVPGYKALRPVRAKVWVHLLFITFALTGRRCGTYVNPGRCPGLRTCWAFSPCRAARMSRNRKIRSIRTCGARPVAPAPLKGAHI